MMDYKELYKQKLGTPDQLAALVQSGMYIQNDIALTAPPAILMALDRRAQRGELENCFLSSRDRKSVV